MRLKVIEQVLKGEPASDLGRILAYRSHVFGQPFSAYMQEALRGQSDWSIGERELFAAFVSHKNQCAY